MTEALEGAELLAKMKELPKDLGKIDKAIACGYVTTANGKRRVRLTAFYAALLAAGGISLEPERKRPGRALTHTASVLKKGHCVVGKPYMEAAGIEPGDYVSIRSSRGKVILTSS